MGGFRLKKSVRPSNDIILDLKVMVKITISLSLRTQQLLYLKFFSISLSFRDICLVVLKWDTRYIYTVYIVYTGPHNEQIGYFFMTILRNYHIILKYHKSKNYYFMAPLLSMQKKFSINYVNNCYKIYIPLFDVDNHHQK